MYPYIRTVNVGIKFLHCVSTLMSSKLGIEKFAQRRWEGIIDSMVASRNTFQKFRNLNHTGAALPVLVLEFLNNFSRTILIRALSCHNI